MAPTADKLAQAEPREVEEVIRPAGLVSRAGGLVTLAGQTVERGGVRRDIEELVKMYGAGDFAAAATLHAAYGIGAPTVDAVSARRYFGLLGDGGPRTHRRVNDELRRLVEEVTPTTAAREWNWGRAGPRRGRVPAEADPQCNHCPLPSRCVYAAEITAGQR